LDRWHPSIEWRTLTPDGRELVVRHEGNLWIVRSGRDSARSRSLDVALIEVVRSQDDVEFHRQITNYATWIRQQVADIEGSSPPEG
jgi:hypothetical protein